VRALAGAPEHQSHLTPQPQDRSDAWSMPAYLRSLRALHDLRPRVGYFTHDATVWKAAPEEVAA